MKNNKSEHSFFIPVMGIGFTIDSPAKVAHLGVNSTISIVDDGLMEKMREYYCNKINIPFQKITKNVEDFRAKRITEYLNIIDKVVDQKYDDFKNTISEKYEEFKNYLDILPDSSTLKDKFMSKIKDVHIFDKMKGWVKENLPLGAIDVNIMTKLDKTNYKNGEELPIEHNDAHAAFRGFANSNLESSVVFSAGMNNRLYSYIENFEDFYPDENNYLKKKIILKVSDYKSALIQGKFLAKKGLWVSEYRIESGVNCGGHAFASNASPLGYILEQFKKSKNCLIDTIQVIYTDGLKAKNKHYPKAPLDVKVTVQGGVATNEEHEFLMDYYEVDAVGWGTAFLSVPEAVSLDDSTLDLLLESEPKDLYLSEISPLGIQFNSLKTNTQDVIKHQKIKDKNPGSSCSKRYLQFNTEFTEKPICTASKQYQKLKIAELNNLNLAKEKYEEKYNQITDKSCICTGLGTSSLLVNNLDTKIEGTGVSVCPGPSMAYFSKKSSLVDMIKHIYGQKNVMTRDKIHMFVVELQMYLDNFIKEIKNTEVITKREQNKFRKTFNNLKTGIDYYKELFNKFPKELKNIKELLEIENQLLKITY